MKQKTIVLFHFSGKGAGAQSGVHEEVGRRVGRVVERCETELLIPFHRQSKTLSGGVHAPLSENLGNKEDTQGR